MNDRPTASEFLDAVERFLRDEAVPALEGPPRFHARVAANVVRMVADEIAGEEGRLAAEWASLRRTLGVSQTTPASREALEEALRNGGAALSRRIRAGEADAGPWRREVLRHLRLVIDQKLEVARALHARSRAENPQGEPA